MYLNGYSVKIAPYYGERSITEGNAGYVSIEHGQQYKIQLRNRRAPRCDAVVFIDGKHVGTWRLNGHAPAIILEHPADDQGKFTAYLTASSDGAQAGLTAGQVENGLVQVTFRPERPEPVYAPEPGVKSVSWPSASIESSSRSFSTAGSAEMGTGLSGNSGQHYGSAGHIEYESGAEVVISLRLIGRNSGPRPLSPAQRGNPVPPPVS